MSTTKLAFFLLLLTFFFSTNACRKKDDVVPYVKVNFTIFLSDPDFVTLQTIGNHVFVTGGVCGIILYRKSQEEFTAIERCCTYQASERCAVLHDTTNVLQLRCPCCNSRFSIIDGAVLSGQAERNLVLYNTQFDPINNTLHVFN
ncbi:MAG: Rieske 2Fe-2S domain-containing protein [Bacteroidales bacterium]|nr:Rieske 2Fe-2S domain-containing protein [Bacteroidales bacterium]